MDLDYLTLAVVRVLGFLFYLGWPRDKRWARIILIIFVVLLICAALAVGLFVSAMGQADWSL
jgi:ABC-type polysaccharide/polyol phosphate export permease